MKFALKALLFAITFSQTSAIETSASNTRFIDIVSVAWPGSTISVSKRDVELAITREVEPRWNRYTTIEGSSNEGAISFRHGYTLMDSIQLSRPMRCEGQEWSSFMNSIREESYKKLKIQNSQERYLIILAPYSNCIWTGRALIGDGKSLGGVMVLQDSDSAFVIIHELGHSLGLGHSNLLKCDGALSDGPWGTKCKAEEYGGAIDVMSNVDVDAPLSVYHQWRMGLLKSDEIRQNWVTEDIELSALDVAGKTRAIFAKDGESSYWIEYRSPRTGISHKPGLVIYRADPPPISSVVSPNPEDALRSEFGDELTADIWLLNWDDYVYSRSKASGSMALPLGKVATTFSQNLSISARVTSDSNKVLVSMVRNPDRTPPLPPKIIDPKFWLYPDISIVEEPYEDKESGISEFQASINGALVDLPKAKGIIFRPTYLNPLTPEESVYLSQLPEGNYDLRLRAIDKFGNIGKWSDPVMARVDRGAPIVTDDLELVSIDADQAEVTWNGLRDDGVGLCRTQLSTQEGFIFSSSQATKNPNLTIPTGREIIANAQTYDCLGNGMSGILSFATRFSGPKDSKRTGKWTLAPEFGAQALRCKGKCSASISLSGTVNVILGSGSATVSSSGKALLIIPDSLNETLRISEPLNLGDRRRVVRVSGINFVFAGIAQFNAEIGKFSESRRVMVTEDSTVSDPIQANLSRFGFNVNDFVSDFNVLPMVRGNTLLDPTLDLCSENFPSESLRVSRRQLLVTGVVSRYSFVSSEVVRYISSEAADIALAELKHEVENCKRRGGSVVNGTLLPYMFYQLPNTNTKLVDKAKRVVIRVKIGVNDSARELLAFYQFHEDLFTGLYVVLPGQSIFSDAEVIRWFDVAEVFANRLTAK